MKKIKLQEIDGKLKKKLIAKIQNQKASPICLACGKKLGEWSIGYLHNRMITCKNKDCKERVTIDTSAVMKIISDVEKL